MEVKQKKRSTKRSDSRSISTMPRKIKQLCKIIWQRRSSHHAVARKVAGGRRRKIGNERERETKGNDVACIVCVRNIQPDGAKRMPSSSLRLAKTRKEKRRKKKEAMEALGFVLQERFFSLVGGCCLLCVPFCEPHHPNLKTEMGEDERKGTSSETRPGGGERERK